MTYLDTLHRIPDDIILAIAAQDFDECHASRCICGWAFRESMARELVVAPESVAPFEKFFDEKCQRRFGGTCREWNALYCGAMDHTARVEDAFVDRLNEIVT